MKVWFTTKGLIAAVVLALLADPCCAQTSMEEAMKIDDVVTIEQADKLLGHLKRVGRYYSLRAKVLLKKAEIYLTNGRIAEARQEFRLCLIATQKAYGETSTEMADVLESYANLLSMTGQAAEAGAALKKAGEIRNP